MTDDIKIELVMQAIRDHAPLLAKAKSDRVYLDQFRKSKKAILYREAPEGTIAEKEAYAYAHPEYLEVLDGLRAAVEKEEELKWRMVAAQHRIEIWRTQSADKRTEQKGYGA